MICRIFAICSLFYDVQWFCFWGCGLSTERVVAYPLLLFPFPQGVKVLANTRMLIPCSYLCDIMEVAYMYFEDLSLQVL